MKCKTTSSLAAAAFVAVLGLSSPASACSPPPGLDVQSYVNVCGGTIMQLYQTHRPNMSLQNYALAWYQVYLRHGYSAPTQQSVQGMVDANARLQGVYERRNAEWHRNFLR